MQRKATKNTRAANAEERRLLKKTKEQPCIVCGCPPPSIADHAYGATFRHNKELIGMVAIMPLCGRHDSVKTNRKNKVFMQKYGSIAEKCLKNMENVGYELSYSHALVFDCIKEDENRQYGDKRKGGSDRCSLVDSDSLDIPDGGSWFLE